MDRDGILGSKEELGAFVRGEEGMWESCSSHPPIPAAAPSLSEDVVLRQRASQMDLDPHSSSLPYFALPLVSGLGGCVNQPRS